MKTRNSFFKTIRVTWGPSSHTALHQILDIFLLQLWSFSTTWQQWTLQGYNKDCLVSCSTLFASLFIPNKMLLSFILSG